MDLLLAVDPNPNCEPVDGLMYQTLEPPRPVQQMRVARGGRDVWCWVTGVESPSAAGPAPRWVPATAQKISDSGAGVAYLIAGGRWGLRLAPPSPAPPRWSLDDPAQWGDPYKLYGTLGDLVLAE